MIQVTKTFLPPIDEYTSYVKQAFDNCWLTNRGQLVKDLEEKLKDRLVIDNILIVNNGTIPLQIALKLFGGGGEVITTPFSYVATTSSIVWENCKPVFVDIHPEYLTIDERKIIQAITPKTTCILATHVFGNACNIEVIENIARNYDLKVIYDAAHCFGVDYKGKSIFDYGHISTCSFHATKLFHTGEGGAIFSGDAAVRHKIFYSHNFGHNGPHNFDGLGINGKISELQAAMGLAVLPYIDDIIAQRKFIVEEYERLLDFTTLQKLKLRSGVNWNYAYFPVIFKDEATLLKVQENLNSVNVFPRRYFFPSLNTVPYVNSPEMPIAESIASRVLCLPLYAGLKLSEVTLIAENINRSLESIVRYA